MKSALSPRHRAIVTLGGVLVCFVMIYAIVVGPLMGKAMQGMREVRSTREQLKALEAAIAHEVVIRSQHEHVVQSVAALSQLIPTEEEAAIKHLSNLAGRAGVQIQSIFPRLSTEPYIVATLEPNRQAPQTPEPYTEIPIQIEALCGYHQLGAFLSLIETGDQPMQVASLRVSHNAKELRRHTIELVLRAYFAAPEG